ncbi:hypothetical protein [Porphyromonas cangingivalis]|uniref:DUF4625 domain-containing protein n=1 Tax=Porphyromonas cangingivalis TaxID=36874 RepID=A0A099WXE4_PORCN|nr:hypothetical protein [Porphyromonas cangingivalis]KGL49326.1 hypothetical protein HQ34_04125 [Porphyromonas cangingivalis]KGN78111.1 hypothetical protein HQ35_10520 [Porphyromonas cangingivalis]
MKTKYILSIMVGLLLGLFYSCNKIPVGYLNTSKAVFIPDTIYVARNIDPESPRAKNNAPWTTLPIQGVAGTNPINYEYHSVKVDKGGDATKFEQMVRAGHVSTRGGMIQIFQEGVKEIPNGNYTISIRIYNEGHSHILKDAVTFIVQDVVEE